jgi:SAM-dependent methyltransferase
LQIDIYSDPKLYDAAHAWKTNDIEFITNCALDHGGPILEMASGTGRLAVPLIKKGFNYTGVELSEPFVEFTKKKLTSIKSVHDIVQGDMKNIDLKKKYGFIFICFNSICHLLTNKDLSKFFNCVYAHLLDGGLFLIDTFVPNPIFLYRPNLKTHVMEFDLPNGEQCIVNEVNQYDPDTQINQIKWFFESSKVDQFLFDMHMIYPDTMDRLLSESGFKIYNKFGDYDKSPFSSESHLQIYLCTK